MSHNIENEKNSCPTIMEEELDWLADADSTMKFSSNDILLLYLSVYRNNDI